MEKKKNLELFAKQMTKRGHGEALSSYDEGDSASAPRRIFDAAITKRSVDVEYEQKTYALKILVNPWGSFVVQSSDFGALVSGKTSKPAISRQFRECVERCSEFANRGIRLRREFEVMGLSFFLCV